MRWIVVVLVAPLLAQVKPVVSQRAVTGQVHVVRVAARFATAIRVPEAVSSVVVGDPERFLVEHSEKEPTLVLVKPVSAEAAESNLLVLTASGRQLSFLLRADPAGPKAVDFVMAYGQAGSFLVGESAIAASEVANTAAIRPFVDSAADALQPLLDRQRLAALPALHGDRVQAGVSEVIDQGRMVIVLFAAVNTQAQAIEIMPPQVQLAGKARRNRWTTSEQLPVQDFRLSRRRLGPGERADGVVVFARPGFKQSHESLFLQVAESGAVDKPALAPIGFGVSAVRKEVGDGR